MVFVDKIPSEDQGKVRCSACINSADVEVCFEIHGEDGLDTLHRFFLCVYCIDDLVDTLQPF